MKLTIGHLYPELLNLYGDRGNIITLQKRAQWRNIEVEIKEFKLSDKINFADLDIVFLGGGSDKEQLLVSKKLSKIKSSLSGYVSDDGVIMAVCGGFQILGHYYKQKGELIDGLGILDIFTESENNRLIGNVIIKTELFSRPIVGFENHGGRTYLGSCPPLGKVICGYGNNGKDGMEGAIYKNVIGTYLHGPLLPKNPHLCDYILQKALERKYPGATLSPLDDAIEIAANEYIVNRFA